MACIWCKIKTQESTIYSQSGITSQIYQLKLGNIMLTVLMEKLQGLKVFNCKLKKLKTPLATLSYQVIPTSICWKNVIKLLPPEYVELCQFIEIF